MLVKTELRRFPRVSPAALTCLLLLLFFARLAQPAIGQGTDGALPDPVTSAEMAMYADRLGLSETQRIAIDRLHDEYAREFRALRDGEIERFIDSSRQLFTSLMFRPDSREARRTLEQYTRLAQRVRALDEGLFDRMESVLTREQSQAMQRVRQTRERLRYRSGVTRILSFANPAIMVDLYALVDGLSLPAEDRAGIEPLLEVYESQMTARFRRYDDVSGKTVVSMVEQLETMMAGFDMQDMQNMQNMRAMMANFERMQESMREIAVPATREGAEIATFNRRTARTIEQALPADSARRFRLAFHRAAYSRVFEGEWASLGPYTTVLARRPLEDQVRVRVEQMRDAVESRHMPVSEQMKDILDEQRREPPMLRVRRMDLVSTPEMQEKLSALDERRRIINEQAIDALLELLGVANLADLGDVGSLDAAPLVQSLGRVARRAPRSPAARRFSPASAVAEALRTAPSRDDLLPGMIDEREFRRGLRLLGTTPGNQAVAELLYADYVDGFGRLEEARILPFAERMSRSWSFGQNNENTRTPTEADIDAAYTERREILAEIQALDARFIADLGLALSIAPESLARLRLARERAVFGRGDGSAPGGGGQSPLGAFRSGMQMGMSGRFTRGREDAIDLVLLLDLVELGAEDAGRAETMLRRYESDAAEALRRRYDAAFEVSRLFERAGALMLGSRGQAARDNPMQLFNSPIMQEIQGANQRLEQAREALVALNRETVELLTGGLSESAGGRLEDLYRRAAYPDVFRDPDNAEGTLLAALDLPDLRDDQREQIEDLLMDFRGPYARISEEMISLEEGRGTEDARPAGAGRGGAGAPGGGGAGGMGGMAARWQRDGERRLVSQRLRFDRTELSERTIRRLMSILDEAQRARMGLDG